MLSVPSGQYFKTGMTSKNAHLTPLKN